MLGEEGRVEACQLVLDAAEEGKLEIVISALAIAEVLALRNKARIPVESADEVRRFFRRQFFLVVDVDRFVAEWARELVWEHGVRPKDAIHVATALHATAPFLDTFDASLIGLSGQVGGDPVLTICKPGFGMQTKLL